MTAPYRGRIAVDIGTGDGKFVYQQARRNPDRLYIGVEPNARSLRKVSEKIYRKPSRGGAPNALFLRAAIESLPEELRHIASRIYILFPWGSLLHAVVTGDLTILRNLVSIGAPEALLEMMIGLDPQRDRSAFQHLNLPPVTSEYWSEYLILRYRSAGWNIRIVPGSSIPEEFRTSWGRRLQSGSSRSFFRLFGRLQVPGKGMNIG